MSTIHRLIFFLIVTFITLEICNCSDIVEVRIKQGLVSGIVKKTFLTEKNYFAFRGIPYAQPPIGELRFKPPKPHQGWEGTYLANRNKDKCIQHNTKMRNSEAYGITGSEDCLYISVFTPSIEGSLAVLVFDYHDNFRTGYNGTKKYSPELFAEEDIIVVTISHRLSLLGYLTTEDDVIPANNGLRDYILGLQWVKENIKYFGGNPDRITLMGNRGGASLANIMLYTKQATGLFNAITMQSGTIYEPTFFPRNPKVYAHTLAGLVDIKADNSETLLAELQKANVTMLYEKEIDLANNKDEYDLYQRSIFPFVPVIEKQSVDAILTAPPEDSRIVNDVPVIIGFNSREGLDHAAYLLFQPQLLSNLQDFFVHFPIRSDFRFDVNNTAFTDFKEEINNFYFKDGYLHYGNMLEYAVYTGDILQLYAINYAARKISDQLKSSTFYYMFDFYGSVNENMLFMATNIRGGIQNWGASAGDELCYLHVCGFIRKKYNQLKNTLTVQNEIKVMKKMVRLWANFAKTGNPTPVKNDDILKNLNWQPIEKGSDNLKYLHITKNFRMEINPLGQREKFWDNTLKKYSESAVDGVAQKLEAPKDEL